MAFRFLSSMVFSILLECDFPAEAADTVKLFFTPTAGVVKLPPPAANFPPPEDAPPLPRESPGPPTQAVLLLVRD